MNSEQSGVFIIPPNPYTLLLRIVQTLCEDNISQNVVKVYEVGVHVAKEINISHITKYIWYLFLQFSCIFHYLIDFQTLTL